MRRKTRHRFGGKALLSASMIALLALTGVSASQENKLLQRVQVVGGTSGTCPAMFVSFDDAITFRSVSFSPDRRTVTLVLSRDLEMELSGTKAGLVETLPDQSLPGSGLVSVSLDANLTSPILTLRFTAPVDLSVSQAGESSIVLLNIRAAGATSCGAPVRAPDLAEKDDTSIEGPLDAIESDFQGARSAIVSGDYPQAIRLLTRLISQPSHERSQEAQELLGLARERNGQLAQAQAEYETYLAQYPNSDAVPRVRQRLAGILTAQAQPRLPVEAEDGAEGPVLAGLPEVNLPPVRTRPSRTARTPVSPEPEPLYRGFLSSYYYRSQGSTIFTEFETGTTDTDDEVYNDALVTSLDIQGQFESETLEYTWRVAGDHELDFGDGDHQLSLSRAYMDFGLKSNGTHLRFGRQSQNEGGIQGRFDGAELTFPKIGQHTISAVFGAPVESSKDGVYENEKLLFGVRAKREDVIPGLDATVYAVHQTREGYTDRQAVGFEAQYQKGSRSIVGIVDYDTYFSTLAFARISGTWLRPDQSSFSITADHVHSPSLSFSNALTGQSVTSLEELSASFSTDAMKQLALDRTQETNSLTLAYSKPISERWQFSVDGSVYHTSGTPGSGGVAAQPSPGTEYFGSLQFVGTNIFSERDTVSVAFRYADASTSNLLLLDAYRRSNAGEKMRWKPRLQVGHRQFTDGSSETFAVPSVNMTYKMNDRTDFELEVGGRFSSRDAASFSEESNELFVTAGFNRQF